MTGDNRCIDRAWAKIFCHHKKIIDSHDFSKEPLPISADMIKEACQHFTRTSEKEVRILCKQDTREQRPKIFADNGIFILPVSNGCYMLVRGEGYVDIPPIMSKVIEHAPALDFPLHTSEVGDSEMQHLDYAYVVSLVRSFAGDDSLVLTIRGRKRTPLFAFNVGKFNIEVEGVQTEVDGGYEGRNQIVLVEAKKKAKNAATLNTIIRQLYYPYRQWCHYEHKRNPKNARNRKKVSVIFFMHQSKSDEYHFWQFGFSEETDYNSIRLQKSDRYQIKR